MDRRAFLKAAVAVPIVAAVAPAAVARPTIELADLGVGGWAPVGDYVAFCHPSVEYDLRELGSYSNVRFIEPVTEAAPKVKRQPHWQACLPERERRWM